mgnify:CR=1 FL=1
MDWQLIIRLMHCFPRSFINQNGEFIAHEETNQYFILRDCKTEMDMKCKVIEWFSRAACKTWPFDSARKNKQFQRFMLNGVNEFLGTQFTAEEMEQIYTYLGNACNHEKTVRFVESEYDMNILEG